VNDELPLNTAFFGQVTDDTGVPQAGVVTIHPGFLAAGMGGILDDSRFSNADFGQPGYRFLDVQLVEESAPVPATGRVVASFDVAGNQFVYAVAAQDLSGPVRAMRIHQAASGVEGPAVLDITASITLNAEGKLAAAGFTEATATLLSEMRQGNVYVNLSTDLNPAGEIRGQLLLVE
jgi:hypothetical protein